MRQFFVFDIRYMTLFTKTCKLVNQKIENEWIMSWFSLVYELNKLGWVLFIIE